MVKKKSPNKKKNLNSFSNNNDDLNSSNITGNTNNDVEKVKKLLKKYENKISNLEKDNKDLFKNNKVLTKSINELSDHIKDLKKWKKDFQIIEKEISNPDQLNEKLPFLLLDIMKNVNNLNLFNQELFNNTLAKANNKRKVRFEEVQNDYEEDEQEYDQETDTDDDDDDEDYDPNEQSKICLVYPRFKMDTNLKRILVYFKLNDNKLIKTMTKRDKQILIDYIVLFENNNKLKMLTKNDIKYFLEIKYDCKLNIYNTEKEIFNLNESFVTPRFKIINSDLPIDIKDKCLVKLNTLNNTEPHSSEYNKLKNWINGLLSIPWSVNKPISINYEQSKGDEIYQFLNSSIKKLDKSIYGQNKTKQHIINVVSKIITNPKSIGNVFSIYGPMGTGKTTLIKDGLSKLLGLPFIFISLGGSTDSSFLDGHSYTYEGSTPGRIVEALKSAKCMNPIFYFDELDKVSETSRGMEIINLLIHLTDPSQNSHFHDKYYGDIPFDLSKALFVFSFNSLERVNPILRDRMHLIKVNGFSFDEKFKICKDYLLPVILKEYQINEHDMNFNDEVIKYIINKKNSSHIVEQGVRNIKRRLEIIISNLNVIKIAYSKLKNNKNNSKKIKLEMNSKTIIEILPEIKLKFEKDNNIEKTLNEIKFPCQINKNIVDLFIPDPVNNIPSSMYT